MRVGPLALVLICCGGEPEPTDGETSDDTTVPTADTDTDGDTDPPPPTDTDEETVPVELEAVAQSPWNGLATGSVWATSPELADHPRRPVFVWSPTTGASTYELEVDDSCDVPGFAACLFTSPELSVSTVELRHVPLADLPVATVPPVGTRYFWRVRACGDAGCSEWTAVRYVDVGRSPKDYDGDGHADVVVGAYRQDFGSTDEGNVFVYDGSPTGVATVPSLRLDNPEADTFGQFGIAVASAGDVNGDGFADLVVGASSQDTADGAAFLFYGSAGGLSPTSFVRLSSPTGALGALFGSSVAAAGDVDGDGFGDVIVGENGGLYIDAPEEGHAYLFAGGETGSSATPTVTLDNPDDQPNAHFGTWSVASIGDTNGDGFVDVAVGAPGAFGGRVFVYAGGPTGLPEQPTSRIDDPDPATTSEDFGLSVASAGDVNGDAYADLVAGSSGEFPFPGHTFVFLGGPAGLPATPTMQLDNPDGDDVLYGRFGATDLAAGDVDGDGDTDLIVGSLNLQDGQSAEGNAFVFTGEPTGVSAVFAVRLDNPDDQTFGMFSASLAAGDIDGDGYADVIAGASLQNTGAAVDDTCPVAGPPEGGCEGSVFLYRGSPTGLVDVPWTRLDDPDGEPGSGFGGAVD